MICRRRKEDGFQNKMDMDKASLPSLSAWEEREATGYMDKGSSRSLPWLAAKGEAPSHSHWATKRTGCCFEKPLHFFTILGDRKIKIRSRISWTSA